MPGDFRKPVVAQKTDRGLLRELNEDACGYHIPEPNSPQAALGALFVIADGVGGMGRGEEASQAAVDAVLEMYYDPGLDDENPRERIIAAIQDANDAVRDRAKTLGLNMLGTTLVGAVILPSGQAYLFSVGDSRIYLIHNDVIEQITQDHSAIDTRDNLSKARLTAFIGQFQPVLPHVIVRDLEPDDTLLICTDGLWGLVEPLEIAEIVSKHPPAKAADLLIAKVHERGARDNVTVTLIRQRQQSNFAVIGAAVAVLVLVAMLIGFALLQSTPASDGILANDILIKATITPNATENSVLLVTDEPVVPTDNAGQLVIRTPVRTVKN